MSLNNVRKTAAVFLTVLIMLTNAFAVTAEDETDVRETVIFQSRERGYKDGGAETRIFEIQAEGEIMVSGTQYFHIDAVKDEENRLTVTMFPRTGLEEGKYEEYVEVKIDRSKVYSAMLIFEVTEIKWPKMIKNLDIEFQEIEAGYVCTGNFRVDLTDYTGGEDAVVIWTCVDDNRNLTNGVDFFESGKTYQVTVGPFVGDGRYYFQDVFTATVNGRKADINMNSSDKKCTVLCKFGPLEQKAVPISKVSLEIKPPVSGSSQFPRISVLGSRGYSVSTEEGALRVFTVMGDSSAETAEGEVFRADLSYIAEITLVTDSKDYIFSDDCAAEVNGEPAEILLNENGSCTVKYSFRPEEAGKTDEDTVPGKQILTLVLAALVILAVTVTALMMVGKD